MPPKRLTFEDTVRAEQASRSSDAERCGHTCRCHGGYVCVRTAHVNHGTHWAHPDGRTSPLLMLTDPADRDSWQERPETRTSHAGYTPDGQLVSWSGPHMTDDQIDQAAAEAKSAHAAWRQSIRDALDPPETDAAQTVDVE